MRLKINPGVMSADYGSNLLSGAAAEEVIYGDRGTGRGKIPA